jgi:hypothetical protein
MFYLLSELIEYHTLLEHPSSPPPARAVANPAGLAQPVDRAADLQRDQREGWSWETQLGTSQFNGQADLRVFTLEHIFRNQAEVITPSAARPRGCRLRQSTPALRANG